MAPTTSFAKISRAAQRNTTTVVTQVAHTAYEQAAQDDPEQQVPDLEEPVQVQEDELVPPWLNLNPAELIQYDPNYADHMQDEKFRQTITLGNSLSLRWPCPNFHHLVNHCPNTNSSNAEVRAWFDRLTAIRGMPGYQLDIIWTGRELQHIRASQVYQEFKSHDVTEGNTWIMANDAVLAASVSRDPCNLVLSRILGMVADSITVDFPCSTGLHAGPTETEC